MNELLHHHTLYLILIQTEMWCKVLRRDSPRLKALYFSLTHEKLIEEDKQK